METYAIIYIVYIVEGTKHLSTGGLHHQDQIVRYNDEWRLKTWVDDSVPGADRLPIYE